MRKDYIMRVIEQFIRTLASIITARKEKRYEEAYLEIIKVSKLYLNQDILTLIKLSPEELLNTFKDDPDRCIICADLIHELVLIFEGMEGKTDLSLKLKRQCLTLYLFAIPKNDPFQTKHYVEKVEGLLKEISQVPDNLVYEFESLKKQIQF